MTPTARRDSSNRLLASLGIPTAESLPLIESEEEVSLRTSDELLRRAVALWAVAGAASLPDTTFFRDYIESEGLQEWLSASERAFLLSSDQSKQQAIHFSWQIEPLYFLSWCAGLVKSIDLPTQQADLGDVLGLFPHPASPTLERLKAAISVRGKSEVMDWADLLYRAHWAVRESQLRGREMPARLVGGAVMEWHKAVNWMTRYEGEEDWDSVATDT